MEEEIDLRPYIEALIAKWYWILGAAVVAGVAALIISSLLPPTYEATALAAITQPTEIVEFDSRIRSLEESQPLKAYPEIALSDAVMLTLLPEITALDAKVQSVEDLRGLLEAGAGADPSLLRLTVTHGDAETTAVIANRWAEIFVARANQIYGNKGGEQLVFFQEQLLDAEAALTAAETALIDFQGRNRSTILANQYTSLQRTQANQLEKKAQIESIVQDTESLLMQVESGDEVVAANQLTTLLLQMRAFGGQGGGGETAVPRRMEDAASMLMQRESGDEALIADQLNAVWLQLADLGGGRETAVPWQIQVDMAQVEPLSASEQTAALQGLQSVLSTQLTAVEATLAGLEPQIIAVQQAKQEVEMENGRLLRDFTLAEQTYTALASKVAAERITSQDVNSGVKLVGKTAVPQQAMSRHIGMSMAVAGILGLFLGLIWVLGITWRSQAAPQSHSPHTTH